MNQIAERMGRRSRAESKRATREALLRAGLAELVEHGLDTPSLDSICARAGYTRGAFYVHFKDRDDFLVAVTEWVLSAVLDALVAVEGESDLAVVVERFTEYASRREWPEIGNFPIALHRVLEAIARSEQLKRRFDGLINEAIERLGKIAERGQNQGTLRRGIDGKHLAGLLVALGIGATALRDVGVEWRGIDLGSDFLALLKS